MLAHRGKVLRPKEIKNICFIDGFAPMSMCQPNDHDDISGACWCEGKCKTGDHRIFDRVGRGKYLVLQKLYWCDGTVAEIGQPCPVL